MPHLWCTAWAFLPGCRVKVTWLTAAFVESVRTSLFPNQRDIPPFPFGITTASQSADRIDFLWLGKAKPRTTAFRLERCRHEFFGYPTSGRILGSFPACSQRASGRTSRSRGRRHTANLAPFGAGRGPRRNGWTCDRRRGHNPSLRRLQNLASPALDFCLA